MAALDGSAGLGIRLDAAGAAGASTAGPGSAAAGSGGTAPGMGRVAVDAPRLYARVRALAAAQSADVASRLAAEGIEVIAGAGLTGPGPSPSAIGRSARTFC